MTNEKNVRPGKNCWDNWGKSLIRGTSQELKDGNRKVLDEERVRELYALQEGRPRGRPPNWLKLTLLMVSLEQIKDLRYLHKPYMGGMLDHLLSPEMETLAKEFRERKRQGELVTRAAELNRGGHAAKGHATKREIRIKENRLIIERYRTAHPKLPTYALPVAREVATWHVMQSKPTSPKEKRAKEIDSLAQSLRRYKQAT